MNSLSNLKKIVDKSKKRLGRGLGSKGAKSGRGTTRHQAAREDIPLHFEGGQGRLVKRFPLLRGKGRNKPVSVKPALITLDELELYEAGTVINLGTLVEHQSITVKQAIRGAKVVATGVLTKSLTIELPVSLSAKSLIEKAGGKVQ